MSNHLFDGVREAYVQSYESGDAAGLARQFTEDCILLPPDGPAAVARAGVEGFYGEQFAQMRPKSLTITPEEEVAMGDWGYGAGTWAADVVVAGAGEPLRIEGKYLNVMKRQADGLWRIHRHTWNAPTQLAALAAGQGR